MKPDIWRGTMSRPSILEASYEIFDSMRQYDLLANPSVEKVASFLKCDDKTLVLYSPRHSIADWEIMANRFYRTFYMAQHIHLDART